MKLRHNSSIYWLITAGFITVGLVVLGYLPISRQLKTQADAVLDKRQELADLQNQVQNFGKLQGASELDQKQTELDRLLIPKSNILEFLSDIEDRAQTAGVIDTISLDEFPANAPAILKHPVALTISGPYDGIVKFLRALDGLDYYLNFNQFSINATTATPITSGGATTILPNESPTIANAASVELKLAGFAYWR